MSENIHHAKLMLLYSPGTNNIIFIQILGQILMIYYTPCFNSKAVRGKGKKTWRNIIIYILRFLNETLLMLQNKIFIIRSKMSRNVVCQFRVRCGNRWWLLRYYRVKFLFFSTFFHFFELTLGGKTNKKRREKRRNEEKSF